MYVCYTCGYDPFSRGGIMPAHRQHHHCGVAGMKPAQIPFGHSNSTWGPTLKKPHSYAASSGEKVSGRPAVHAVLAQVVALLTATTTSPQQQHCLQAQVVTP